MNLGFFIGGENKPVPLPNTTLEDVEKRGKIVSVLCGKRKALEWNLANREANTKEIYQRELSEHIEKMNIFGISETDYAIYLAKNPQHEEETLH